MHNIHDDAIGLYYLLKNHVGGGSIEFDMPFNLNRHRIMIIDEYGRSPSSRVYDYFSSKALRFRDYLHVDERITCFRDAVFGSSRVGTWYQYGFTEPQGPIMGKNLSGEAVREV